MPTTEILLQMLLRSTILLAVGYLLIWTGLKICRVTSPRLHRLGWLVVLLTGWLGGGIPVDVPWRYEAEPTTLEVPVETVAAEIVPLAMIGISEASGDMWSQAPREAAKTQAEYDVSAIIAAVWLIGAMFFAIRTPFSYLLFRFRLRQATAAPDNWFQAWQTVLAEKRVPKIPMLVAEAGGPALVRRLFGYVLVVPPGYWQSLSPEGRLAVLRHEREHFLRRDALKSFFVRILALPQWFNPLAWSAVRRFDEAAEWACDEAAISRPACGTAGDTVADFAEALVALHESLHRPGLLSGFAGCRPSMRIRRLVQFHQRQIVKDSPMKKIAILLLLGLVLLAGLFRINLVAQTAKSEAKTANTWVMEPLVTEKQDPPMSVVAADPWASKPKETKNNIWYRTPTNNADTKPSPEVGKFRVPIDYKLKNITPQSLSDFLKEQFKEAVEVTEPVGGQTVGDEMLTITASLDDHKLIKRLITEIQREVEAIRADAAETEPATQIKVFTVLHAKAEQIAESIKPLVSGDVKLSVDQRTNTILASGSPTTIGVVEALLLNLDKQQENPPPLSAPVTLGVVTPATSFSLPVRPTIVQTFKLKHILVEEACFRLEKEWGAKNGTNGIGATPKHSTNEITVGAPTKELLDSMERFLMGIDIPANAPAESSVKKKEPDLTYILVHIPVADAMHRLRQYCTENDKKGVVIFPGTKSWEKVLHVNAPTKELVEEIRIFLKAVDTVTGVMTKGAGDEGGQKSDAAPY